MEVKLRQKINKRSLWKVGYLMKTFFTQPIGNLARQNAITFLVLNLLFVALELSGTTALDALEDLINFIWGFSLATIVITAYYLAEDHVPDYWRSAHSILATVIIFGTFLEITELEDGFLPMYFFWAFNSLIYSVTLRGNGVFRPIYENMTILGALFLVIGSSATLFFGFEPTDSFQQFGFIGWLVLIIGFSLGNYFAWGDKSTTSNEVE